MINKCESGSSSQLEDVMFYLQPRHWKAGAVVPSPYHSQTPAYLLLWFVSRLGIVRPHKYPFPASCTLRLAYTPLRYLVEPASVCSPILSIWLEVSWKALTTLWKLYKVFCTLEVRSPTIPEPDSRLFVSKITTRANPIRHHLHCWYSLSQNLFNLLHYLICPLGSYLHQDARFQY